jgi:hypothetical protein
LARHTEYFKLLFSVFQNFRKLPKSREKLCPFRYRKPPGHQTVLTKIELLHDILSLKQQAQRIEKNIEGYNREKNK